MIITVYGSYHLKSMVNDCQMTAKMITLSNVFMITPKRVIIANLLIIYYKDKAILIKKSTIKCDFFSS